MDDDDQARREIDASMNFKRQEALRHKKKDSRVRPASEHPSHHRRPDLVQQHVKSESLQEFNSLLMPFVLKFDELLLSTNGF